METIDPTIKNLVSAIGRAETGDSSPDAYNRTGKSGEFGRYQFMPDSYKKWSSELGIDSNDRSISAQNKIAYNKVKQWKEQGLTPAQIASKWNSGDENAYKTGHKGVNSQGVEYDTPAYTLKVSNYYKGLSGSSGSSSSTPEATLPKDDPTQAPEVAQHINDMFDQGKSQQDVRDFLKSIREGTEPPANTITTPKPVGYWTQVGQQFLEGGQKIVSSVEAGANKFNEASKETNPLVGGLKTVQGAAGSFLGTFGGAFQTVFSPVTPIIGKFMEDVLKNYKENPEVMGVVNTVTKPLDEIAQKHPEETTVISDALNALLAVIGETKLGGNKLSSDIKSPDIKIKNPLSGLRTKTAEQIAQVAEKDVAKLSTKEQAEWYKQKSLETKKTAEDLTLKAKEVSEQATKEVKTEINDFNQKIGTASRETAIDLKPKAQQVMKDASNEYIKLTGEAADGSPALTKTISHEDLGSKIDNKFEYNPEIATALKNDLGIKVPEPKIGEDGLAIIETNPKVETVTNQQILDKAREIMQRVSKTARTGGKVYSPAEYEAMKQYSFLMETLGENGVDMKAANQFWKNYVPVRERIVREIKPFDDTDVGKIPFTSTVQNAEAVAKTAKQVASKLDAQNFIAELESRMGLEKGTIGSDVREAIEGLEKAKISKENIEKITKETLRLIKEDKAQALETMSLKKYNTSIPARRREILKKAILYTLGIGVLGGSALHVL